MLTALLFSMLTVCLVFNLYMAYNIWTVDYDNYHPWARYVVTLCAIGSALCYVRALWEVSK